MLLSTRRGGSLVLAPCQKENFNYSVKSNPHVPSPLVLGAPPPSPTRRSTIILLLGASLLPPCSELLLCPLLGASPTAPNPVTNRPNTTAFLRCCPILSSPDAALFLGDPVARVLMPQMRPTGSSNATVWSIAFVMYVISEQFFIEAVRPAAFVKFLNN